MSKLPSKRVAAIAAVALVAAAGGGAAVAASSGGGSPSDFLDSVAKHLGVSRQKLDDATKAAAIDQVDAQLAAGKITKAQADDLKQRIEAGDVPLLGGGRGPGRGFGPSGPGLPGPGLLKDGIGDSLAAAAKYLGLSESDLRSELNDGQSLADVAKAQGKDLDGLKQAIIDAAKVDLDTAVADKKLTQSQADDVLARLKSRIDDLADGQLGFHGPKDIVKPFIGGNLDAAAKYLGLSQSDLSTKLRNGQSLADVAKAQGKDVDGLKQAIIDAARAELDKAVADKKLTQSQADDMLNRVKDHIDDLVNVKPGNGPRFRDHGRVPGGPRWFGP
jgi:predicted XRE-type DNA-binding protein